MSSLSAWFVVYFVFPLCIFKPTFRLSEFRLVRCLSICFVVSLKRATWSANLKLVRFSPSTLTCNNCCGIIDTRGHVHLSVAPSSEKGPLFSWIQSLVHTFTSCIFCSLGTSSFLPSSAVFLVEREKTGEFMKETLFIYVSHSA